MVPTRSSRKNPPPSTSINFIPEASWQNFAPPFFTVRQNDLANRRGSAKENPGKNVPSIAVSATALNLLPQRKTQDR
jgi:hypothetical protein